MKSMKRRPPFDVAAFIRANLELAPVPSIPDIKLYLAHSKSGLGRLAREQEGTSPPPYWAYAWAGGTALVQHILAHPEMVRGKRILDLGSGSGLVGIAAAMSGAASVTGAEIDPVAQVSIGLNCAANGVSMGVISRDLTAGMPPPGLDLVLVGDLLYDRELAGSVVPFLSRCRDAGMEVIVGDPGRGYLPLARLRRIGAYGLPKVEEDEDSPTMPSGVFVFE